MYLSHVLVMYVRLIYKRCSHMLAATKVSCFNLCTATPMVILSWRHTTEVLPRVLHL
jgi:hypothetical protein